MNHQHIKRFLCMQCNFRQYHSSQCVARQIIISMCSKEHRWQRTLCDTCSPPVLIEIHSNISKFVALVKFWIQRNENRWFGGKIMDFARSGRFQPTGKTRATTCQPFWTDWHQKGSFNNTSIIVIIAKACIHIHCLVKCFIILIPRWRFFLTRE